ncbi:ATP-dependent DNA helicase homolog RECG, chloroplastic isoform X2 [Mangifera indica]|uniref:ATP-dependent DNA helicase homolog RECG, chloroplastic isoform X2 n=1 Tax=Mangifera indica TaxID=29780 RepID=UPI001CFA634C|nr:ATP-dependent DNA helicase homolog RECG, chloroplastic isoform X2 [Mangifera indica]
MALVIAVTQSCGLCFSTKQLRSAIIFQAKRGYRNVLGRNMRFSNFLLSKVSRICYRSKHKYAEKLMVEVVSYDSKSLLDRSKLFNKVPVLMGYNSLNDLIENGGGKKQSAMNQTDAMDDFDVSMACKRFPSIILGHSPPVELYDETKCSSEMSNLLAAQSAFLRNSMVENWDIDVDSFSEAWSSLCPASPNVISSIVGEENSINLPLSSQSMTLKIEENFNIPIIEDESSYSKPEVPPSSAPFELWLERCISCVPGLSKRLRGQMENCGFHTLRKLLHHFPRTYADVQNAHIDIEDGQYFIFVGNVLSSRGMRAGCSFSFLEVIVGCEVEDNKITSEDMDNDLVVARNRKKKIYLHLKRFFRGTRFTSIPFLRSIEGKHKVGEFVCVTGKMKTMQSKDHYEMREYNIDVLKEDDLSLLEKGRPYPIYPSKGGLNPDILRQTIASALNVLPVTFDPIPKEITQKFKLLSLYEAYIGIHQPKHIDEADLARKRLIFDEFFYLQLARIFQMLEGLGTQIEKDGLLEKYRKPKLNAAYIEDWSSLTKKFLKALPYSLTSSQLSAVSEIIWDLKQSVPMNRLLQGDVGCGKTVVAFLACMEVIGSGYQAAFMVPTELLAIQHYEHFLNLLEIMVQDDCKPSIALLTGSTPLKQSRMIRKDLQTGDISLVIGTHSLIAESVEFCALRLAIVDEQQRFGVIQRGRFNSKLYNTYTSSSTETENSDGSSKGDGNMAPHILAMSATPIPRTLALALYGDMSLTQITDLPPGRKPVKTYIIEGNDNGFEDVYKMMLYELESGGKVYLVYPVIKQSEQLPQLRAASVELETVSSRFKKFSCGLLHGRMKSDEKDEALRRFRSGETHILLSTQVIEIGVDVPDASMMVVMNAERFGMAQLHQLRGRVGRGERESKCILVASSTNSLKRLQVLEKSSDGFYLANMDLLQRGPGDLLGKKQSGHLPEFPIARLEIDGNILQDAHLAALRNV